MKKIFIIAGMLSAGVFYAQSTTTGQDGSVGINAQPSGATLDVQISADAKKTEGQGIAVPRVTKQQLSEMTGTIAEGALVYVNTIGTATGTATERIEDVTDSNGVGFYYFDKTKWVKVGGGASTAAETQTFTRNIREDNRTTVVVDQLQDGSTSTKDYYIIMTGNPTAVTMPAAASNKGRVLCFYNPGTNNAQLSPTGVGTQGVGVDASQSACYISNGTSWYGAVGW